MRVALLADFPVHTLPGFEGLPAGHHATWLPPLAHALESHTAEFNLHWITCTKDISEPTTLAAWGQTFHLIPRGRLSVEMLTAYRRERSQIARLLGDLKPDLVHAWGTEQGYGYAANDFPGPSLLSLQGILQTYCKAAAMPWLTRLQAIHEARVLHRALHLTVESPWGADQLRTLAPHATIDLLEYGADPACFEIQRSLSSPVSSSSSLPLITAHCSLLTSSESQHFSISASQHLPLALFVGSLTRLKGIDTLLTAFSDPSLHHVELVVLGTIPPQIATQKLPPHIHLLGHRPAAEVREWMARAWCLVHPTRADTSPNCVKEARVIGLPVVTTPNGGQTQYVTHGKSGFIHEAGDTEGLIQGVLAVTRDRETSLLMGTHGQAECCAKLHPSATAARLLEIYQKVGRYRRERRANET